MKREDYKHANRIMETIECFKKRKEILSCAWETVYKASTPEMNDVTKLAELLSELLKEKEGKELVYQFVREEKGKLDEWIRSLEKEFEEL